MTPLGWILVLVVVQRIAELVLAKRNTGNLRSTGAREIGAEHYPLLVLLHATWLGAMALLVPWETAPIWPLLYLYALLQLGRLWVIASLGRFWTTRIMVVDDAPMTRRGPYRFLRHPNYWIVAAEIAVLPLAFRAWPIALIWSALNAVLLRHRIRVEEEANAHRPQHG